MYCLHFTDSSNCRSVSLRNSSKVISKISKPRFEPTLLSLNSIDIVISIGYRNLLIRID